MYVTRQILVRIARAYQAGRPLALLFNYDGTLVPIAPHPTMAVLFAPLKKLLERLSMRPRIAVGFMSGRSLADLKGMVGLSNAYYVGANGLEIDLRGTIHTPMEADNGRRLIEDVVSALQGALGPFPGAWVENKELAAAVHFRNVEPPLVPLLQEKVVALLRPLNGRVHMVPGPKALEINPNLGWNKGTALRHIVEHVGPNTFPLFAGNISTDADAFEAVKALGGIALGVGAGPPHATCYQLLSPAKLAEFLTLLVNHITLISSSNSAWS